MEDYCYSRSHVPAFGSWDWNNDLPFTECFESARQAALLRYSYSGDRDLYVAGDLYDHHVVTPAVIVVPRRKGKIRESKVKEEKNWAEKGSREAKAVDEDLYKIPAEVLYAQPKKKRGMGFFSSCLIPTCVS